MSGRNRLLAALQDPGVAARWSEADWSLAIRQARSAQLLAALAHRLREAALEAEIPEPAVAVLGAALRVIEHRNRTVLWECSRLVEALAPIGVRPIFLKGAAYVLDGLRLARHRHFGDIDLMVPRARLGEVETQLMLAGWLPTTRDAYDQRYYRQWMHEVPPLRQIHRGTTLDLHHALTPLTARYRADTAAVFAAAGPAKTLPSALVLAPTDQILHAATHLFAEGEAEAALRNLYDLAELLSEYEGQPGFLDRLVARAQEIGLARPLFLAVHFLRRVLARDDLEECARALSGAAPGRLALAALEAIYDPIFEGMHPSVRRRGFALACQALYLRGHWLRMPLRLLIPHLTRKVWKAITEKPETAEA